MKVEYINPFLKSTIETFKVMVSLPVTHGRPYLCKEPSKADISSIIELSGDIIGYIIMVYPITSALKICSKFLKEDMKEINADVVDCIGEIANIVTGFAKKDLLSQKLSMSLPSVVKGQDYAAKVPKEIPVIGIPFESEAGTFIMEVRMASHLSH